MAAKKPEDVKKGDTVVVKGKEHTATGDATDAGGNFVDIPTKTGQVTAQKGTPIKTKE